MSLTLVLDPNNVNVTFWPPSSFPQWFFLSSMLPTSIHWLKDPTDKKISEQNRALYCLGRRPEALTKTRKTSYFVEINRVWETRAGEESHFTWPLQRDYIQMLLERCLPQSHEIHQLSLLVHPQVTTQHLPLSTGQCHTCAQAVTHVQIFNTSEDVVRSRQEMYTYINHPSTKYILSCVILSCSRKSYFVLHLYKDKMLANK